MMHRAPQRSYTPQSVEAWFLRLNQDWERYFSEEELRWGRRFYRNGEVRSTELMEQSAIIHFKQGKEPLYIIVDWEGSDPSFRLSHPGFAPGRSLAVAGMYELEEFIADEVPPVIDGHSGKANGSERRDVIAEAPLVVEKTGRRIQVKLSGRSDGLWIEAGWRSKDGKIDWKHFSLRELTLWEREQLIGYTARAHRCGFRPGNREGSYRMQEPMGIERFFKEELRDWKARQGLLEGHGLETWKRGVVTVHPVIKIAADGPQGRFAFHFGDGLSTVPDSIREVLFHHPGHPVFSPGQGIFQVDPATLYSVHEWRSLMPSVGQGILPRYLLYNFARDPKIELVLTEEISEWRKALESAESDREAVALPDFLRDYQCEGVHWLRKLDAAGCHGLLADEMGLGKTIQILSFLDAQKALGKKSILVVCPASVVPVWQSEIDRFYPGTPTRLLSRQDPFDSEGPILWISSYTQLRRNKHLLADREFAYAVLDEAQSIKNPDAKVSQACMAIRSHQRIALTGTPLENRPLDLWTLFRFLMPGFLGNRHHFEEMLKRRKEYLELLRKQIAPFILRRTKRAVAKELPEKVEIDWICPLTPVQSRYYTSLTSGAASELSGELSQLLSEKRMHLFSLLTRLRQVCCDPYLLPGHQDHPCHSGKLLSLTNRLEEAFAGGSKVVVFSQFVQFLRRARSVVREAYPDVPQLELTGSTLDRLKPVQQFNETEGAAVFFISLRAGGTGLNLQAADYVFLLDPWWNPAVEDQAIDRVHRIGQRNRVIVYRMITRGTIEERIGLLKKRKGQLFDELLSDLDAPADLLKQFGNLEELIALDESGMQE